MFGFDTDGRKYYDSLFGTLNPEMRNATALFTLHTNPVWFCKLGLYIYYFVHIASRFTEKKRQKHMQIHTCAV